MITTFDDKCDTLQGLSVATKAKSATGNNELHVFFAAPCSDGKF